MSSQTTDTPGTTTTNRSRIAPEQLFKLTRSWECLQIRISAIHILSRRSPPLFSAQICEPFSGCLSGGRSLSFRISGGDSNYFTRREDPAQIRLRRWCHSPRTPNWRGFRAQWRPIRPFTGKMWFCAARHSPQQCRRRASRNLRVNSPAPCFRMTSGLRRSKAPALARVPYSERDDVVRVPCRAMALPGASRLALHHVAVGSGGAAQG